VDSRFQVQLEGDAGGNISRAMQTSGPWRSTKYKRNQVCPVAVDRISSHHKLIDWLRSQMSLLQVLALAGTQCQIVFASVVCEMEWRGNAGQSIDMTRPHT